MTDGIGTTIEHGQQRGGTPFARRRVLDAVVLDGTDAVAIHALDSADIVDLLDDPTADEPLWVCRRVNPDGSFVLGAADPDRDPLLSYVIGGLDGAQG